MWRNTPDIAPALSTLTIVDKGVGQELLDRNIIILSEMILNVFLPSLASSKLEF